jgi:hypothetical protein
LKKASLGIEDVETVTVNFPITQFQTSIGNAFEPQTVEQYMASAEFKRQKGFKYDGKNITATMQL